MVEEEYEEEKSPPPEMLLPPMPMLPNILRPPAPIVDARVVDVALKLPNVGVLVATMTPDEFVERIELIA